MNRIYENMTTVFHIVFALSDDTETIILVTSVVYNL